MSSEDSASARLLDAARDCADASGDRDADADAEGDADSEHSAYTVADSYKLPFRIELCEIPVDCPAGCPCPAASSPTSASADSDVCDSDLDSLDRFPSGIAFSGADSSTSTSMSSGAALRRRVRSAGAALLERFMRHRPPPPQQQQLTRSQSLHSGRELEPLSPAHEGAGAQHRHSQEVGVGVGPNGQPLPPFAAKYAQAVRDLLRHNQILVPPTLGDQRAHAGTGTSTSTGTSTRANSTNQHKQLESGNSSNKADEPSASANAQGNGVEHCVSASSKNSSSQSQTEHRLLLHQFLLPQAFQSRPPCSQLIDSGSAHAVLGGPAGPAGSAKASAFANREPFTEIDFVN